MLYSFIPWHQCTEQMAKKCSLRDGMTLTEWAHTGKLGGRGGVVKGVQLMAISLNSEAKL